LRYCINSAAMKLEQDKWKTRRGLHGAFNLKSESEQLSRGATRACGKFRDAVAHALPDPD
jgi:hypothetical protein